MAPCSNPLFKSLRKYFQHKQRVGPVDLLGSYWSHASFVDVMCVHKITKVVEPIGTVRTFLPHKQVPTEKAGNSNFGSRFNFSYPFPLPIPRYSRFTCASCYHLQPKLRFNVMDPLLDGLLLYSYTLFCRYLGFRRQFF